MSVKGTKDYWKTFKDIRQMKTDSSETTTRSIEIKRLRSGTRYSFQISAVTGGGKGESVSKLRDISVSG